MTVNKVAEVTAQYVAELDVNVVPAGYKKTEVGVLPDDWETPKFGDICTLINGRGFKPYEWNAEGLPIIRIQNLNGSDEFNYYRGQYDPKIFVKNGQLLFAWSGSRGTSFGPHIWYGEDALLNYHTWKLVVKSEAIDDRYFFHILKQLTKQIEDAAHGASALVHTQKGEMEGFFVPLPTSREEQTAIANALSDVDALISELEKLIAKKQAIKTATMQQLLTGCTRLPQFALREDETPKGTKPSELGGIPEDWEVCELQDAVSFLDGLRRPVKSGDRAKISGIYPYYGASGIVDYVNDYIFDDELILLGEDGENILSRNLPLAFKVSGKIWVNNHAHVMKPNEYFDITYLTEFLESLDYSLLNSGTAQPKLNKQACLRIKVAKPSKEEQTAIATILSDMDADLQALQQRLDKTRQIKQGMMQELLTGKTRLVKPESAALGAVK